MAVSPDMAARLLDLSYGDGHGATMPDPVTLRFFIGDPLDPDTPGVELDGTDYPGYAALDLDNDSTNFPDADPVDGSKTCPQVLVCVATGDWIAAPDHYALCDGSTVLDAIAMVVDEADVPLDEGDVKVTPVIFYNRTSD